MSDTAWLSPSVAANMVFLDPAGPMENFSFGVLRRELRGVANDPVLYARAKLQPIRPDAVVAADGSWPVTAAASALLAAPGVPDGDAVPQRLFPLYRDALLAGENAMLLSLTMRFPEARFRHEMMEEARAFALERLARARRLSTLVTLHVPGEAGSGNLPHAHLVALVREHHAWGFGTYVREVYDKAAQALLFEEWTTHRRRWAGAAPDT